MLCTGSSANIVFFSRFQNIYYIFIEPPVVVELHLYVLMSITFASRYALAGLFYTLFPIGNKVIHRVRSATSLPLSLPLMVCPLSTPQVKATVNPTLMYFFLFFFVREKILFVPMVVSTSTWAQSGGSASRLGLTPQSTAPTWSPAQTPLTSRQRVSKLLEHKKAVFLGGGTEGEMEGGVYLSFTAKRPFSFNQ